MDINKVSENSSLHVQVLYYSVGALGIGLCLWLTLQTAAQVAFEQLIGIAVVSLVYAATAFYLIPLGDAKLNIGYPVVYAALVKWGPAIAMWIVWPAYVIHWLQGKIEFDRMIFNIGQINLSVLMGYFVFVGLGGSYEAITLVDSFIPLLASTLVFDLSNTVLVSLSLSIKNREEFVQQFISIFWDYRRNSLPSYHSLAILGALLMVHEGVLALVLLVGTLLGIHSMFKLPLEVQKHRSAALRDGMTGVMNYRFFKQWCEGEGARLVGQSQPFSMLFVDIDQLKVLNDTYGHPAGDEAIRTVAKCLGSISRSEDHVIRYGGDEFLLVLPNTDLEGIKRVSERWVECLENAEVLSSSSESLDFATSSGIGAFPDHAENIEELFANVDKAAYRAKSTGGNTVFVAQHKDSVQKGAFGLSAAEDSTGGSAGEVK